jgi:hypothetical protein
LKDFSRKLYDAFYINFTSFVPRNVLEELAAASIQYGISAKVAQVFLIDLCMIGLRPIPQLYHVGKGIVHIKHG